MKPLLTLVIIALVGVSLWWSNNEQKTSEIMPASTSMLDAYMNNFSMQAMDESGQLALLLTAKSMKKYSDSEMAELDTPRIKMQDAQQGFIDSDRQTVSLQRNVIIQRRSADQQQRLEIRTDSLQININQQIAQTDAAVEMIINEATFTSKGLILDNRNGKLSLLAEVKGVVNAE